MTGFHNLIYSQQIITSRFTFQSRNEQKRKSNTFRIIEATHTTAFRVRRRDVERHDKTNCRAIPDRGVRATIEVCLVLQCAMRTGGSLRMEKVVDLLEGFFRGWIGPTRIGPIM